jgi:hypothetical protein
VQKNAELRTCLEDTGNPWKFHRRKYDSSRNLGNYRAITASML